MTVPPSDGGRLPLRPALSEAAAALAAAGVHSPRVDAEYLAAHVLGVQRPRLALVPMLTPEQLGEFRALVARRAERVPLQHLTGVAAMGEVELAVGPGVFVPRPETELLFAWALAQLEAAGHAHAPVVVDLCTGSGALALAVAHARPDAEVHAIELDPAALAWARRNADRQAAQGDTPITLHAGDVTDPRALAELDGRVDVVVANPPYIPVTAELEPEVLHHDPHAALFGGPDGLSVIEPMIGTIARLLRAGGVTAVEHDDSHGSRVSGLFAAHGGFTDIAEHPDLAGRPRFVVAQRVRAD
ncbi:peptide chain release factor N(5)-glutamine methyltransferase [Nocardia terpenica]|uniref:peptide chain release factor N(5)-glutamine methyltransferase n=1 Tax=Nocardia terpenica TaxID=455432 RepID=UPI001896027C|nr:peptide chain release factor N(5)-glutamine methyltransferase [Nocardia terpenica]MBF6062072.1 peptide chain release factor N(5)-glutamine methyltransferase [Nocardia terpenica]MBF6106128.1 peptide chain release factor N(5)-glutamine methyltransferase [Nocardia terpenica]MBF6110492.1 peptide chain release factor N(5)-glutamine methyltransferase [Nocardia terpenica]MBF6120671.1 peptide chain release factor N(5)-glutamine methyltransferase [Nocardia terpenica]MBF6151828.1 peptide chain releas